MYKIMGLALMGIFAMMIIPGNFDAVQGEHTYYGAATVTQKDNLGNEVFSQVIHNRIVDTGENFLLQQTFQDTNSAADDVQIGSICVSIAGTPTIAETETAADFDGDNTALNGVTNCKEDTSVGISSSVATIGPLTFNAGGTNVNDDDTITAIGICQNDTTDDLDFEDCATEGILFALVDVTDTTLGTGETVDITYTFDISSATT